MARRSVSNVGGFVHDIDVVASLSDEPDNARLLSDRSLYILQNLSSEDITFLSRYGEILPDGFYLPVQGGSSQEADVIDAIDLIRRDLNDMSIATLLECICQGMGNLVGQEEAGGQEIESVLSDGQISVGQDEQFPDQSSYFDAKCNVSNGIFDTVLEAVAWLDDNNVDLLLGLFGGVTSGLVAGLIGAGPFGWAIIVTASVIAGMAAFISRNLVSFSDLKAALADTHSEAVLALFNATDTLSAESGFIAMVEDGTPAIGAVESGLLRLMLTSDMLNNLFVPRSDVVTYQSPDPVDCGAFIEEIWSFVASGEGWAFVDESDGTYSASGVWLAGGEEAWEITLVGVGGQPPTKAKGVVYIDGLAVTAEIGGSVQMDFGPLSSGPSSSKHIRVTYDDMSEFEASVPGTAAGTVVLTLTEAGTIEVIETWVQRSWSTSFTMTMEVKEVRVFGV